MAVVRITVAVAKVLRAFLEDPAQPRYGYELMRVTGFPSGKLYPILAKLQAVGWLVREREDIDPSMAGRPARRLYRLSPEGTRAAREELTTLSAELRPPMLAEQPRVLRTEGGLP
ncbi:MAG TPA: helix-turn-helix transcriptional regulator [Actinophytocola sp.]|uniref:PadR family transcriptional regulator n=1 Tax=Actinophytocola sp. TaxID=1872138 RepID=UPI002DBBD197|nr:helix-turn-helix transcriptional regulator [Actinophytocola sp.]HEU5473663.1 helix-turn-helix transcriptional regulator [Actinophytocola sp.]